MLNHVAAAALLLFAVTLTLSSATQESGDLVSLDVTVVDDKGRPVTGLKAADFQVKDDGGAVGVTTFSEVTADNEEIARSIVVMLDDVAVPSAGTETMRTIARAIVSSVGPRDEIAVVRLSRETEEAFGDRTEASLRIGLYRAGATPFTGWNTQRDALRRMAGLARQLESIDARRKIIVCIGAPVVCNVDEPSRSLPLGLYPAWVEAIVAAARTNVNIYAIIPGRARLRDSGVVHRTGGEVFATTYDVGPAIERVLQDANHYYLLGYWPAAPARDLHRVEVKVARKGLKVRARTSRGN